MLNENDTMIIVMQKLLCFHDFPRNNIKCFYSYIVVGFHYSFYSFCAGYVWYSLLHCGSPCGMFRQFIFSFLLIMHRFLSSGFLSLVPQAFDYYQSVFHCACESWYDFTSYLFTEKPSNTSLQMVRTSSTRKFILLKKLLKAVENSNFF